MDVESSPLIYDDFPSFINNECTAFDDFDEFLPKTEPIDYLSDQINQQQSNFIYDNNNYVHNYNIPNDICKMETKFNPDEFLNYFQPEEENKLFYTERNTPSPTNSSTSSFSSDSNSLPTSNSSISSSSNNQNIKMPLLDTPPISPSDNIYNTIGNHNQQQNISKIIGGPVNLLQGTVIPISKLTNLNKTTKLNQINLNQKPKTIVLSSKDFNNLIERYNNGNQINRNNSPPKIIVKQNSINKTISVYPKIAPQQQQQQQSQQNNLNPKILPKPDIKMINSIIDEKTLKKQQRMIKNRKSACLSRMKKNDYLKSLEKKLDILEKENSDLKVENTSLRCQLDSFSKQCLCNCKRKFSDIISLSNNKNRNTLSINKILMGSTLRKNTAVLLAMVFMVSINFGTINNFLNPQISKESLIGEHYGVRSLLWINDDNSTIKTNFLNNSKIPKALPLQQLHLNKKKLTNLKICPIFINQTENLRLASELQKWIDTNDYLNLSTPIIRPFKYPSDYINQNTEFQTLFKNMNNLDDVYIKKNKKNYFNRNTLRKNKKITKLNNNLPHKFGNTIEDDKSNTIQVFQPKLEYKYKKLFEEIRLRDDTFYVVSFNTEHILLPASAYNKSSRPKMSLMLPASDSLLDGKFTLMQIDCEVLNTTLIQLKEELIPKNLRPKFNNNNRSVNVPTRTHDKNTTTTTTSNQNQQFNILNNKNFNNFKLSTLLPSNHIRKHQHLQVNELSEVVEVDDDNEFNKKINKFNHIYKPYFKQTVGNGNITNDIKINNDKLLP